LTTGPGASSIGYRTAADFAPDIDAALIERAYLNPSTVQSSAHLRFGMTTTGVGYLRIAGFSGDGLPSEIDDALKRIGDVPFLILDLRDNGGGKHDLALDVAGRFASARRPFGYVRLRNGAAHGDLTPFITQVLQPTGAAQFRGTVLLLTNRRVYSSAEDFVLALRVFPNVIKIGDTTGGSSGKPDTRELPNGWTFTVSTWIEYDLERNPIEDRGIAPSIVVMASPEDRRAGIDRAIERALELAGPNRGRSGPSAP
jgi:C-terminal processing protease CtpA/Prc